MIPIFPPKLKTGDFLRVISPSSTKRNHYLAHEELALKRFQSLGLTITFGKHLNELDELNSTTVAARLEDFHSALRDPTVKMILASEGGFNSNSLLPSIDWDLVYNNPKIIAGFSDITVLTNAVFTKTCLVSYSTPFYRSFAEKIGFDYTEEYFRKCLFSSEPFEIMPSPKWSEDNWWADQVNRNFQSSQGFEVINEGAAEGTILGGNLQAFVLMKGSEFFPNLSGSVLFLEDDDEEDSRHIDSLLQSLIIEKSFPGVKGIVFGRFRSGSNISTELLTKIISSKPELKHLPIISDVNFGHTTPVITFPIGGTVRILANRGNCRIDILRH